MIEQTDTKLRKKPKPATISTAEAREMANVTLTTLLTWCNDYTVDGEPLGVKVGGRWRIYKSQLTRFLSGEGEKIER